MEIKQPKKHQIHNEYNFNLKIVMYLVAVEVFILVSISFIKIYVDKKHSLIANMRDEVEVLEKIFLDYTDYSSYVLGQMGQMLKKGHDRSQHIEDILSHYSINSKEKEYFGWRGFYWLDGNGVVKHKSADSSIAKGTNISYLSNVRLSKISPNQVFYGPHPSLAENNSSIIDLALGITRDDGTFVGTFFLQLDTYYILEDLEKYRRYDTSDFAIVDSKLNVVMAYPINTNRLGIAGRAINLKNLKEEILEINFASEKAKEISYLNMLSGKNYLVKKIKNKPYAMVVSINPVYVKSILTKKVAVKFIEIAILASFFLILVLLIYRRETWLRAKAEKASQIATKAMVAKSDFLSYAAHEIRSPLGFILTGSEIMKKNLFGPVPESYQKYVAGIYNNSRLILDFINEILDERHIASGNFKLTESLCNVEDIIKKAINTNKTRFHERKITIKKDVQKDIPFIFGDERKILQTLNNLISNSYKYSLDNTEITVSAQYVDGKISITVLDQGIGMTDEEIKIALTKYGTAHANKPINFVESYGLGLPIVVMLTSAHEATLEIKSTVDVGTSITIIFPSHRIIEKEKKI